MAERTIEKLGLVRVVLGAAFALLPKTNARLLTGRTRDPRLAGKLFRALGARDVGLGLGLLRARSGADSLEWLRAAVVADAGDLLGTVLSVGRVPLLRWALQVGVLAGATLLDLAMIAELERPSRAQAEAR